MDIPALYKKDSKGKIQIWEIEVTDVDGQGHIKISSGKLDGRRTVKERIIRSGKNIGRANETTPVEQAQAEAKSAWQNKKDKDYYESIEEAQSAKSVLPMLAHKFIERSHDIIYPCTVQPKLDGVRCMVYLEDSELVFMSRGGKRYDALLKHSELCEELKQIIKNDSVLDGELYVHGWSLQRIVSAAKAFKEDTLLLQFWAFDIILDKYPDWGFNARWVGLQNRISKLSNPKFINLVSSVVINNKKQVKESHDAQVKLGFEGLMIRNSDSSYIFGKRSKDLQKYKEFIDEEFEIVDTECETNIINGVTLNSILFTCVTKEGEEFGPVRPKGTLQDRDEMWKKRDTYVGKQLTVRYFTLTDSTQGNGRKVPQFPIGLIVRDYE